MNHDLAYSALLSAPVNVTWEITSQCNLRCRHCLSADLMHDCVGELDLDQCRRVIDELDEINVFQINFGGGEPFLREDFLGILEYCHSKGITTCVSTNGTALNDSIIRRLMTMDLLYIQVSLDGATPHTNDALRGKGTFDRIINGIEALVSQGFPHLSTNTVVTAINFKEIGQLHELGRRYGIKTRLSRFRPSGNAKRSWQEYRLSHAQLVELSAFLNTHPDIATGDSFFSITGRERRNLGLNMCGAARMTCSISPDGTVYPCAFLQDEFFKAGTLVTQSLRSIWQEAHPFQILRQLHPESCQCCSRFNLCHGGCPAVAYFLTRSLDKADPECMVSLQQGSANKESYYAVTV